MRSNRYILPLVAVCLAACSQMPEPDWSALPGSQNHVLEYGRQGIPRQRKLTLRESEQQQLRVYLQNFVQNAEVTRETYAPGVVVSGETYTLNFPYRCDSVVLSIWQKGASYRTQLIRKRTPEDEAVLQMALKKRRRLGN